MNIDLGLQTDHYLPETGLTFVGYDSLADYVDRSSVNHNFQQQDDLTAPSRGAPPAPPARLGARRATDRKQSAQLCRRGYHIQRRKTEGNPSLQQK